jgi:hypothetical protein
MKQYMTVPMPMGVVGRDATGQHAAQMFGQAINQQAQGGWTYHSMEQVTITQTGCVNGLLSLLGKPTTFTVYMLIFEGNA